MERDLHDGAQARLIALGISLRATERLIRTDPDAAVALVAAARENSARALAELRGLVRGIDPPVLAERGLADGIRALALDSPVATTADILPGRLPAPVEAAAYFAVAEAMANGPAFRRAQRAHQGGAFARGAADRGQRRRRRRRRPGPRHRAARHRAQAGYHSTACWRSAARWAAPPSSSSRCRARRHRRDLFLLREGLASLLRSWVSTWPRPSVTAVLLRALVEQRADVAVGTSGSAGLHRRGPAGRPGGQPPGARAADPHPVQPRRAAVRP